MNVHIILVYIEHCIFHCIDGSLGPILTLETKNLPSQKHSSTTTNSQLLFQNPKPSTMSVADLFIGCPACAGWDMKPTHWKHKKCGTRTRIRNDGYLGCKNIGSGCSWRKFSTNKWSCKEHRNEYIQTNSDKYKRGGAITAGLKAMKALQDGNITADEYSVMLEALSAIAEQLNNEK